MQVTNFPIKPHAAGLPARASQSPGEHQGPQGDKQALSSVQKAKHVPSEHTLEGELLKGRLDAQSGRHGSGGRDYTFYGGYEEQWAVNNPSAQRAISVYRFHAQPDLASAHIIDDYA